ncbi:RagB/SusD family nutrient uptake outer membrane protein [Chitinophaga nivalis]|uniref:RagB/SusD family nutrient uptake outer membrane protein n=1 Tax=Chitinophaga nivalis TaxID=2991709 RepID=A0ABT3IRM6_9BACT|nr:RagB/SusD family nutrient uptake outer membrane protein [Chitinophaga nivalis]MCW3463680.1 RagB/SusD family nutrient uptake outer membrane protein [Chitinophaga nivalis]MCW3486630.1 RagB/SusD family nutrient uptake outer membrane protein [Chitinophaga nivalis]
MFTYKNTILALVTAVSLAACTGKLDEPKPDTSINLQNIQPGDLPLLLNGAYKLDGIYYQPYAVWDIYSDDIVSIQGGTPTQYNPQAYDACNPNTEDGFGNARNYASAYKAIGNANFIINYINSKQLTNMSSVLGEALCIRAYNYLRLAESYGGVILTLQTETDINQLRRDKNSEAEVRATAIADLTAALPLLGDFNSPDAACKQTAQLLLARTYLQQQKNREAGELALQVINSGKFTLSNSDYGDIYRFNTNSREMMWRGVEGPLSYNYDRYGLFTFYSPGAPFRGNSPGLTWVSDELAALYEPADIRKQLLHPQQNDAIGKRVNYLLKYSVDTLQAASANFAVYPYLRYSEALLIAAEASARQGTVDVTYYNQLRTARKAGTKNNGDFASPAAFLKELENERRREFVGEGRRWQDMRRFGTALPYLSSLGRNETRLYLPFSSTEMARNPKLTQNKGY